MTGFGSGERCFDRFGIAHFAQQNHVGVFAHGGAHGVGEGIGVHADLTLCNDGAPLGEQELYRVLDGDDVLGACKIDLVAHRRKRGRFAGTGRTGHDHEPALELGKVDDDVRQLELRGTRDFGADHTQHHADAATLLEHVGTHTADVFETE